jgi:hypothetical protein
VQRLADQELVVTAAIEIAGVDQGDAGIESGMDVAMLSARSAEP